jgi:hypothetical protein
MMKKMVFLLITCLFFFTTATAFADMDEAFITAGDTVIARPCGLAALILGSAFFIVSLPFAAASGSVKQTADTLVSEPFKFTFTRPLGDFQRTGLYRPARKAQEGKTGGDDATAQ